MFAGYLAQMWQRSLLIWITKNADYHWERYKREDKTKEQYFKDLVGGITIGVPLKILKGINEYLDLGMTHFIFQFIGLNDKSLILFYSKVIRKV